MFGSHLYPLTRRSSSTWLLWECRIYFPAQSNFTKLWLFIIRVFHRNTHTWAPFPPWSSPLHIYLIFKIFNSLWSLLSFCRCIVGHTSLKKESHHRISFRQTCPESIWAALVWNGLSSFCSHRTTRSETNVENKIYIVSG